jgi:hypothetical protein
VGEPNFPTDKFGDRLPDLCKDWLLSKRYHIVLLPFYKQIEPVIWGRVPRIEGVVKMIPNIFGIGTFIIRDVG